MRKGLIIGYTDDRSNLGLLNERELFVKLSFGEGSRCKSKLALGSIAAGEQLNLAEKAVDAGDCRRRVLSCASDIERSNVVKIIRNIARLAVLPAEEFFALHMLGAVDNIGNNGARRGHLACALAVEYNIAYCVSAHENGVENIVNGCKLAVILNKSGRNHNGNLAVIKLLGACDKLDNSAP